MIDEDLDLLQIKITNARKTMPQESLDAIDAVDWRKVIFDMKERKGYTFEQLGDLEIETELLLCGLINPLDYPKELEKRMKISEEQAKMLVNEMNEFVFKKVRSLLVKNIEEKKLSAAPTIRTKVLSNDDMLLKDMGIEVNKVEEKREILEVTPQSERNLEGEAEMIRDIENPNLIKKSPAQPILAQKLGGSFKMPGKQTEYDLNKVSKKEVEVTVKAPLPNIDPYRINPEDDK